MPNDRIEPAEGPSPCVTGGCGEVAHTPVPWTREPGGSRGSWIGNDGHWSALACGDNDFAASANAALIVRAVNAHADLVAALREALDSRAPDYAEAAHPGWYERAKAALAKAETP